MITARSRNFHQGRLDAAEAKSHPAAHTITQYLGKAREFAAETHRCPLDDGDVILLFTDGLSDVLSDERIADIVASYRAGDCSFKEIPHKLVAAALAAQTQDNVTVLCCEYRAPKSQRGITAKSTRVSLGTKTEIRGYPMQLVKLFEP